MSKSFPRTHVFVYGTLRRGEPNHRLLGRASFVAEASTLPHYRLVHLGSYPGLLSGGERSVRGEVYSVDRTTLEALDDFEGHPDFYCRQPVTLGSGLEAEAYLLPADRYGDHPEISSGEWRAVPEH